MSQQDQSNIIFKLAEDLVCSSNKNIFLTGKAGTGKTTFLRHIKTFCSKNLAIVAPTGVAAINAGGTTIHSFFQLPFGPFDYNETKLFFSRIRINNERRQVFRQLELLIIDEISMVRADLLDAIDVMLRHFRFRPLEPFGGVQVLMIGDLYQLSPVTARGEWELVSNNYPGQYFFDSRVMRQYPPVSIAFDKIYRQQDENFVNLLNQVRNNDLDDKGIKLLQSLYKPDFKTEDHESHIILTTHNATANRINTTRLNKLESKPFSFNATIEGEFNEKNFPADQCLTLKEGARVMFIKNDPEKEKRFYNGKIGTVLKLSDKEIIVRCDNEDEDIIVPKETWKNIRYAIDKTTQQLQEDLLGSFSQYPLRLAWAVTIHKSQGLTFNKVVVDAGAAFTSGQVYVALSRCTSLDGMVLLSPIARHALINDQRVVEFTSNHLAQDRLNLLLVDARNHYQQELLLQLFDYNTIHVDAKEIETFVEEKKDSFSQSLQTQLQTYLQQLSTLHKTSLHFIEFIKRRFAIHSNISKDDELQSKLKAAAIYFTTEMIKLRDSLRALAPTTDSRIAARELNELLKNHYVSTAYKYHLILSCKNGFSIDEYFKSKKAFTAPSYSANTYSASTSVTEIVSAHPELFKDLKALRDKICNTLNKPAYFVASTKMLTELCAYLPLNTDDLQKISGYGRRNSAAYGEQFLNIIISYCAKHNLASQINLAPPKRQRKERKPVQDKTPSHHITEDLYKQGHALQEIASQRNLALSTIQSHIARSVGDGRLDPHAFITEEKLNKILNMDDSLFENGISSALPTFGSDYTYFDINLALAYKRANSK